MKKKFKAALYCRLSKEDGRGVASESIKNQLVLLKDFVSKQDDIEVVCQRIDDGFSGVNLDRPQFRLMEEEIRDGLIDCVIVKDLSRLARNFVESGKFIQSLVYHQDVRFIAINDNIDSKDPETIRDSLIIPFKNLINDFYLADTSLKIRSQFDVRRKKGEYVSGFVTYGYLKSPENKKKLIVDEAVRPIIEDIFSMKLDGWSATSISDYLNQHEVLSPLGYKQACGVNLKTTFQTNSNSEWSANAIFRILKNQIYMGTMVQGKTTKANHKVKKREQKPESQWDMVPNTHESIISPEIFEIVQTMLSRDGRTGSNEVVLHPLSGLVFCGDCQASMIRQNVSYSYKPKYSYVCGSHKNGHGCSRHAISVEQVEQTVLATINAYILSVMNLDKILNLTKETALTSRQIEQNNDKLLKKQESQQKELVKIQKTYENFQSGILNEADFKQYTQGFKKNIEQLDKEIEKIKADIDALLNGDSEGQKWMRIVTEQSKVTEITRKLAFSLIDKIEIKEDKKVNIIFKFKDEFENILSFITTVHKITSGKEAS